MNTFDFSTYGVRSWLNQGMLMLTPPKTATPKRAKYASTSVQISRTHNTRTKIFATLTMGISISATAYALNLPNQSAYVFSHAPEVEPSTITKNALLESLKSISILGDNSHGEDPLVPSRQAIIAAEQIVPSLPNIIAEASAGVDGDGNVFLKLQKGGKLAYLTVEPSTMHLLVMISGAQNLYVDDVKFKPRQLPPKIRQLLEQEMVG